MAETIAEKNIIYRILSDETNYVAGAKRAVNATNDLDKAVEKTANTSKKAEQQTKKAVETEASAAQKRATLIKAEERSIARLTALRKKAYNPSEIQSYNAAISSSQQRIKLLRLETEKTGTATKSLSGIFNTLGITISAAYAISQVKDFVLESVKLANQTRNVRNAFNQLPGATRIMNELRTATSGTVDDLTLMQAAVRADKFQVPLNQLASFFKFATDRAAETGQEVDYLVNSIVDGIGRKSSLVLDNLGISAAQIQEEFKKTGDFGAAAANVIEQQMRESNVVVDEGARAAAELTAQYSNLKIAIGDLLVEAGANELTQTFSGLIKGITDVVRGNEEGITSFNLFFKALADGGPAFASHIARVNKIAEESISAARAGLFLADSVDEQIKKISDVSILLEKATEEYGENSIAVQQLTQFLEILTKNLDTFKKAGDAAAETEFNGRNLAFLNAEIEKLTREQNDAATSTTRIKEITSQLNALYREQDALLGRLKSSVDDVAAAFDRWETELKESNEAAVTLLGSQDAWDKFYTEIEEKAKNAAAAQKALNDILNNIPDEPSGAAIGEPDFDLEENLDDRLKSYSNYASQVSSILGSVSTYQQRLYENDLRSLETQLDQKTITEQQYAVRVAQIKRREAQGEKQNALFQAIVSTASAVAEALPNIPLSVLAGIAGAAQIALISSTPIPQFAKGVIDLQGPGTGTSDSIPAKLSKGESVMTAKETSQYGDVFHAIRANKFDEFAKEQWIKPAMIMQQVSAAKNADRNAASFDDYRLRKAIHENRNVGVRNADDIGRSVAKYINQNAWRKGYIK